MGNLHAAEYAEAVREGYASLRQAIAANLQSNHFPPLPVAYVEPIIQAIESGGHGDILLPSDIMPRPRAAHWDEGAGELTIEAGTLLDITHSWGFVYNLDYDDEV